MADLRRFLFIAALLLCAGVALHRVIGAMADAITVVGLVAAGQATWRQRRARLEAIRRVAVQLRHLPSDDRHAALAEIESDELRDSVAQVVASEGSETRDGVVERFPLPAVFRVRAERRFWRAWSICAAVLAIAAFIPDLAPVWRVSWLGLGVVLAVRAYRKKSLSVFAASQIEITPFRVSYLRPDGTAESLSFADGVRLEDMPACAMLVARSGDTAIPISYHLLGVTRLLELLKSYGVETTESSSPAS